MSPLLYEETEFVKILSINVAECEVKRAGFEKRGNNEKEKDNQEIPELACVHVFMFSLVKKI